MSELLSLAIQTLIGNPLTVSLVILGTICVALAIVGKIPPMHIEGGRAIALAGFGILLIVVAIVLAWALAVSAPPTSVSQAPLPSPTAPLAVTAAPPAVQRTDTPKAPATDTPPPPTFTPTVLPTAIQVTGCNGWCEEIGQIPESGTRITKDLAAGQLMFLSGGQLLINDKYCGDDAQQICILIYEASKPQTVVVDAVIAKNNYVGITDTYSPEQALSIKKSTFWKAPNCINGCRKATVLFFRDGEFVKQETLTP